MAGYTPANYMSPNTEIRKYGSDYYQFTPTKIEDMGWGAVGKGGTVTKLTEADVRSQGFNPNSIETATINPTNWVNNAKYTPDEIKANIQQTFGKFDPQNTTGWTNQLDTLVQKATNLYNADPTRQDKVFGDVWNEFRYKPETNSAINKMNLQARDNQIANNNQVSIASVPKENGLIGSATLTKGGETMTVTQDEINKYYGGSLDVLKNSGWAVSSTTPATAPQTTQSAQSTVQPNFIAGLSQAQKDSITNLVSAKPSSQWNETDVKNWNYATGGQAFPSGYPEKKYTGNITADSSFNKESGIVLPGAQVDSSGASAAVAGAVASVGEFLNMYNPPESDASKKYQSALDSLVSIATDEAKILQDKADMEKAAGLADKRQEFATINGKIKAKNAEFEAFKLEQQGKPMSANEFQGSIAAKQNKIASDILILQAQAQGIAGEISAAQETINSAIDLRFKVDEAKANIWKAQMDAIKPTLDKEEAKTAKIQEMLWEERKQALADKKDEEKRNYNLILGYINDYKDAGINISDTLAQAQSKLKNSKIYQQATRLASGGGGGTGTGNGGANEQLYSGLSSATATAVRSKVSKFSTEPLVQNFATIQDGYNFASSIPNTTENPADDQALIYSLAKALDPGSVVREGEYATAQKYSQSWIQAYGKGVTQALAGTGFLSETARRNIKATIEQKYNSSKRSYDNISNQYESGINSLTGRKNGKEFLVEYTTPAIQQPVKSDLTVNNNSNNTQQTTPATQGFLSKAWNWMFGE